ncbi:NusG domain II-containing protein [Acetivibrio cellulolyticus]|uniref:NusG domain II-containing protein n=1 Tax=Acetivibrio cellulolyticus TaxID=35830 RepID=UPI0001E2DE37|nr:NusG domain II-containing protein [Acetivibrio cellulolyticus]
MSMNMLKKGDIILVAIVIAIIAISFGGISIYKSGGKNTHKVAVIKVNDRVIEEIDLDTVTEPRKIEIPGYYNEVVLVEKGRIRFEEAQCPDKLCVKTGWLSERGDMAACIPNSALIKIEGQSEKVDVVTY